MSKARLESALLEELQKSLNDACIALKKTADIPITRFTLSIPAFFDSDPSLLGLCKQLIGDLTSIDAWNQYIVQISPHKDTCRTQFVKLLNCLLRFVNIMSNKNNQQVIDMMVLLAEIQRNDEESLKSFRQFANMKLGLKSATFVVKYAKYECLGVSDTATGVPEDVPVQRAIAIIKAGIKAKAEPVKKLKDALDHYNGILDEINRKLVSCSMDDGDDFVTAEVQPRRSGRKSLSAATAPTFDDGEVEFNRPSQKKAKIAPEPEPAEDRTIAMPARTTGRGRARAVAPVAVESSFDDGEVVFQKKGEDAAVAVEAPIKANPVFDDGEVVVKPSARRKRKSMSKADAAAANAEEDNTLSLADYCPTVVIPPGVSAKPAQPSAPAPVVVVPEPQHDKSAAVRKRRVSFVGSRAQQETAPATVTSSSADGSSSAGSFTNIFADSNRMLVVNNHHYVRLTLLGKGGSSAVHRVASVENGEIYAFKKVDIKDSGDGCQADGENSVLEGYINEIKLLKSLSGSAYTIQLFNYEINREENYISMVMEAGDVDLAKVLQKATVSKGGVPAVGLNPFFTRLMWQEMLESVDYIHTHHVIHGDLKPANFVFIKGHLKLIDFGIAKSYNGDQTTNIYRDSQIGTVNYMAPEAISPFVPENNGAAAGSDNTTGKRSRSTRSNSNSNNGDTSNSTDNSTGSVAAKVMKLGRASDIWSLGCILYQMIYGKPPFSALNTIQKLHAIPNPNYAISYPSLVPAAFCGKEGCAVDLDAVDSIKACLLRNPKERAPIKGPNGLLGLSYLTMNGNSGREDEKPAAIVMTTMKNGGKKPQMVIEDDEGGDSEDMSMDSEELARAARAKKVETTKAKAQKANDSEDDGATVAVKANQLKALGTRPARLNAPASRRSRSPVRSPLKLAAVNNENRAPVAANQTNSRPLRSNNALPTSLAHQIQSKAAALTDSKSVNKWQKAKNPEGKGDMKSVLEKRFAAIRHFLEEDESDEDEDTSNFDSNMSFI